MSFEDHQFQPGRAKTGGRAKGTRNRVADSFLKDLLAEWQKSGPECLKIMAKEDPSGLCKLTAALLPRDFGDEMPSMLIVATGVPRYGDPLIGDDRPPRIPMPVAAPEPEPKVVTRTEPPVKPVKLEPVRLLKPAGFEEGAAVGYPAESSKRA